MRGRGYKTTNWLMIGLLLLGWQLIILNYAIPIGIGLGLVDVNDSLIIPFATIIAFMLAYITGYVIRRTFTNDGKQLGKVGL